MQNCFACDFNPLYVNGFVQQKEIQVLNNTWFFLNTAKATVRRTSIHDFTRGEDVLVESISDRENHLARNICVHMYTCILAARRMVMIVMI